MRQQVGDAEDRVAVRLAQRHAHLRAVLAHDDAVQRQRHRQPLVLLDAAVVVRIQIGQAARLVQRVLLYIQARGIDVRAEDVHALLQRMAAHHKEQEALVHPVDVDAVACLERAALAHEHVKIREAARLRRLHGRAHALALGLSMVKVIAIRARKRVNPGQSGLVIGLPGIFSLHDESSSVLCLICARPPPRIPPVL